MTVSGTAAALGGMAKPFDSADQSGTRLHEIADYLGISISRLHDEAASPSLNEMMDLIRLFCAIDDPQGRRYLLHIARMEAARSQDPSRKRS